MLVGAIVGLILVLVIVTAVVAWARRPAFDYESFPPTEDEIAIETDRIDAPDWPPSDW